MSISQLLSPSDRAHLRRLLLTWFAHNARDLPWRQTRDPYAIWISEVMLQQTTVAAVIPYYHRFLAKFPNVERLANADEAEVLHLWQGLGYYRRARSLFAAAQAIVADHQGIFPRTPEALSQLPGMGRYTVGAVLSQAFDARLPIVEANSLRVLCRLMGLRGDPSTLAVRTLVWQAAEYLLPRRNTGTFNQALMELGAVICTPRNPACERCPISQHCAAFAQGAQDVIPAKVKKPAIENVREISLAVSCGDKLLLVQRPPTGRWAHLWEFPRGPWPEEESVGDAAKRLLASIGMRAVVGNEVTTIRHGVTRFRITLTCFAAQFKSGAFRKGDYISSAWITLEDVDSVPMSTPQRRLFASQKRAVGLTK